MHISILYKVLEFHNLYFHKEIIIFRHNDDTAKIPFDIASYVNHEYNDLIELKNKVVKNVGTILEKNFDFRKNEAIS